MKEKEKCEIHWLEGIEYTKTTIDEIKEKFGTIKDKKKFIELIASKFKKQPRSIQNHWMGGFWSIPKQHQTEVLDFINNYLKHQ